ncbi:MAG: hypothetical protein IPP72_06455 [Chitinophagaceae bacterium]|nr:hypothetical protein [Chitinophagaceae bacterium]
MELQFKITGILLLALALVHLRFPKRFNWSTELKSLSLINRQMMTIHTFFIALALFLMGLLCLTSAGELIHTNLGKRISLGLGIFWVTRLLIQFFGYSSELWKGKRFETIVHIFFSILWLYLSILFFTAYLFF